MIRIMFFKHYLLVITLLSPPDKFLLCIVLSWRFFLATSYYRSIMQGLSLISITTTTLTFTWHQQRQKCSAHGFVCIYPYSCFCSDYNTLTDYFIRGIYVHFIMVYNKKKEMYQSHTCIHCYTSKSLIQTSKVSGNSSVSKFTKTGRHSKRPSINHLNSEVWFVSDCE